MVQDSNLESLHAQAFEYIAHERFHRRFTLPATSDHEALTISYSDVGCTPEESSLSGELKTILFIPGMFASRFIGIPLHPIAQKLNLRVLVVDRFGMGQTTDVPLKQRIPIWIELVPVLLNHLGIKHVGLVSHSAGTLYLLNTLAQLRHILDPENPLVVCLGPWVNPSISRVMTMQMAQYIPNKAFGFWNMIPKFFLIDAAPVFATSGTVVTKFSNMLSSLTSDGTNAAASAQEKNMQRLEEVYGLSRELQAELEKTMFKKVFEESTIGANSEALQCLRKGDDWTWGSCDDYTNYVKDLVQRETEALRNAPEGRKKLRVRVYFAETDSMIGDKGRIYFQECWKGQHGTGYPDAIDLDIQTVKGVDHDSLVHSVETIENIFIQAGGMLDLRGIRESIESQRE